MLFCSRIIGSDFREVAKIRHLRVMMFQQRTAERIDLSEPRWPPAERMPEQTLP